MESASNQTQGGDNRSVTTALDSSSLDTLRSSFTAAISQFNQIEQSLMQKTHGLSDDARKDMLDQIKGEIDKAKKQMNR